jgi:hypothetical protein
VPKIGGSILPEAGILLFSLQYITGKFRKCQKPPEQSRYLPRSQTGNIFPSWTVVVRRHHVYVREFHLPSCYSVGPAREPLDAAREPLDPASEPIDPARKQLFPAREPLDPAR